jgi:hypothetical protein
MRRHPLTDNPWSNLIIGLLAGVTCCGRVDLDPNPGPSADGASSRDATPVDDGTFRDAPTERGLDASDDTECFSGNKNCEGVCVRIDDPAFGCTRESCSPCVIRNGEPVCAAGVCVVARCIFGYEDCNTDPLDGCEVDVLRDRKNCGGCGKACPTGYCGGCKDGLCDVTGAYCMMDCDGDCLNGAETDICGDSLNCGSCEVVCPAGTSCFAGLCVADN